SWRASPRVFPSAISPASSWFPSSAFPYLSWDSPRVSGGANTATARMENQVLSDQSTSRASMPMRAFNTFETGQPCSACFATSRNLALSAPEMRALTSRCDEVISKPSPIFSSVTVAEVSIESGSMPALPSSSDSAIEKQAACAAAMSSSGLVPLSPSKREPTEYPSASSAPLAVLIVPRPSLKPPFQVADPLLCMSNSVCTKKLVCADARARCHRRPDRRRDGGWRVPAIPSRRRSGPRCARRTIATSLPRTIPGRNDEEARRADRGRTGRCAQCARQGRHRRLELRAVARQFLSEGLAAAARTGIRQPASGHDRDQQHLLSRADAEGLRQ